MNILMEFVNDNFLLIIVSCSILSVAIQIIFGLWSLHVNYQSSGKRGNYIISDNGRNGDSYELHPVGSGERYCNNCELYRSISRNRTDISYSEYDYQQESSKDSKSSNDRRL